MTFLAWLEATTLSIWLRESVWGFFAFLTMHSLAMGVVIGVSIATALRLLGVAPRVPLTLMSRFLPFLWLGVAAVTASGLFLLLAYPAKALTNWVFYFKLFCIVLALCLIGRLKHSFIDRVRYEQGPLPRQAKLLSVAVLLLWTLSITAGRFLAYTYTVLMAGL